MTVHIINPNNSTHITEAIEVAVAPMSRVFPVSTVCHTLSEGPSGIETQSHINGVVQPLLTLSNKLKDEASAFVIACFSDPGVAALREVHNVPVLGIAECAYLQAMLMGQRFGIISLGRNSVQRHIRHIGGLGIIDRLAADLPIDLSVAELANENKTLKRLSEIGITLRDQHGADVLITGCAGMTQYRSQLENITGLPVVDPCQAATAAAFGQILFSTCSPKTEKPV